MQPVTMTRPFSFSAGPMAASDSALRAVEEAAGVDDDGVGAGMRWRKLVALGAQPGDDALAIDERLRAAERDERDARRGALVSLGDVGHAGRLPRAEGRGKAQLHPTSREREEPVHGGLG